MSITIPDGTPLVSPQSLAEYTSGSKTGTKHQAIVLCNAAGAEKGVAAAPMVTQDIPITPSTANITATSQTVFDSVDITAAQTLHIVAYGTYAVGPVLVFEATPDPTGTVGWAAVAGQREDTTTQENTTPALQANTTRAWSFFVGGFARFRVRSTAFGASGTVNLYMAPSSKAVEPGVSAVVGNPPGSVAVSYNTAAAGVGQATVTEALNTMVSQRDLTAAGTATTFTVPAGKTFRILGMTSWARNGNATATMMQTNLRAIKTGTITATTGGILIPLLMPLQNVVGYSQRDSYTASSNFIELQSGWSWGVSSVLGVASAATIVGVSVYGIEY